MKIFLSGTDREYDLQCLSLLFFPGSDFSTADGKELFVKIEGKTAEAAKRHNLPVLAEMPIDPALAALVDAGDIESFQGTWLDGAADQLEGK